LKYQIVRSKGISVSSSQSMCFLTQQFITFAGVGAIGTTGHYIALIVLVQAASVAPVVASSFGFAIGALINYVLNYRYTFRSSKRHCEAMIKFFTVAALGATLNGLIMAIGTKGGETNYILIQICATAMVVLVSFLLNRLWTFNQ
jgi:putative flippase GtrA